MLFSDGGISMDEWGVASLAISAQRNNEVLAREFNVSTTTTTFKPDVQADAIAGEGGAAAAWPPKYNYNIEDILNFLLNPANAAIIDADMSSYLHTRYPLRIKNPSPNLISPEMQEILMRTLNPPAAEEPPCHTSRGDDDGAEGGEEGAEEGAAVADADADGASDLAAAFDDIMTGDDCGSGLQPHADADAGTLSNAEQQEEEQGALEGDDSSRKRKRKGAGHFLNQLTMSYTDEHSTKSVKVFRNRTIHITGCKSPTEARVVATLVWSLLCRVYPDTRAMVYRQQMVMVNATCELNYSFNPKTNQRCMSERYRDRIVYVKTGKNNKYPGTILKLPASVGQYVTVMMFASGNLTFSCRSLADMVGAYRFVLEYYGAEKMGIMSREPILSKRKIESARPKRKYVMQKPRKNARKINYVVV